MTDRIVEVGRKVRNTFVKNDLLSKMILWIRLGVRKMTIQDLEKINQITFDDSYASPKSIEKKLSEMNFSKKSFGFSFNSPLINPDDELFYDIILGNNELFKKCYEKLQKVGSYKSKYRGRVKNFFDFIKTRAT